MNDFETIKDSLMMGFSALNAVRMIKDFLMNPELVIEHDKKCQSIFAPERTYQPQNIHRKFLRTYVRNKHACIAQRCKATLIVTRKSHNNILRFKKWP